jgi:uncharacterized protein YjiS (DUF1127 family)
MTKQTIHSTAGANELSTNELTEMEMIRRAHRARSEAIANWLETASEAVGRWFRAYFRRGRERQRIMNELYSLDDRSLSDLGITRGDIPFVANGHSRIHNPRNDNDAKAA